MMKPMPSLLLVAVAAACLLAACQPAPQKDAATVPAAHLAGAYAPILKRQPSVAAMTAMGRAMFFEPSLSVSGKLACASCHSPQHAYGPPNALAVQLGGPELKDAGTRAAPSLRYLQNAPPFSEHYHDDDGDDSVDAGPTGGRDWSAGD